MSTVYFISGHTDITQEQFDHHYRQRIVEAASNPLNEFVMVTAPGADTMSQKLLTELMACDRMTVYHRGESPEFLADPSIKTVGGWKSHDQKDAAMTKNSDVDILYVRSTDESKKLYGDKFNPKRMSGTQKNLNRRIKQKACTD